MISNYVGNLSLWLRTLLSMLLWFVKSAPATSITAKRIKQQKTGCKPSFIFYRSFHRADMSETLMYIRVYISPGRSSFTVFGK